MKKYLSASTAIILCILYLTWRTVTNLGSTSLAAWALIAAEIVVICELAFYFIAKTFKHEPVRKISNRQYDAVAVLDARNGDDESLRKSLYALEKSKEILKVYVVNNTNSLDIDSLTSKFGKLSTENIADLDSSEFNFVLWVNAGDVVFANTVSICSNYVSESSPIAVPSAALWSSSITTESDLQNYDRFDKEITSFISSKNGILFAGETALISTEFFKNNVQDNIESNELFTTIQSTLAASAKKCIYAPVIAVERHDKNSMAEIAVRTSEIRQSLKSVLKLKFNLTNLRNASRPFRALAIVAISGVAIWSTISNTHPFDVSIVTALAVCSGFYILMTVASYLVKENDNDSSHIHHSMKNFGSDITCLFTKNNKVNKFAKKYLGMTLATLVSVAIVARIISNKVNSKPQGLSAPAIIFALAVLSILLYGLEMVTIKQRRKSLRRNVILNAKIADDSVEITDLSPNDCGLIANSALAVGELVELTLSVPSAHASKEITLNARVVNSTDKGVTHRVGCVFEDVSAEASDALEEFCTLTYPQSILNGIYEIAGNSAASNVKIPKIQRKSVSFVGNGNMKPLVRAAAIIALLGISISNLPPYTNAQAATTVGTAGTIAGYVYQDFNLNGVKDAGSAGSATDIGVEGVKVIATCSDGQTKNTTTVANGQFIISGVNGSCRVSVDTSTLPVGMTSAAVGNDSNSLVQFVASGTANIGFGIGYPGDYCQSNPALAVACFSRTDPDLEKSTIYTTGWESGAGITPPDTARADGKVLRTKTGAIYGLGYKSDTKQLFSSAYLKRKTDFGTGGIAQIYVTNNPSSANPTTSPFLNLTTIGVDVGTSPRTPANAASVWINDGEVINSVGKVGIGDIMVSADNKTLFAVNMFKKTLVSIDLSSKTLKYEKAIPSTIGDCPASDLRPMGLGKKSNGEIFIGVVCSGESSQDVSKVRGYVLKTTDQVASTMTVVSDFNMPTIRQSKGSVPDEPLPYYIWAGFNPWKTNIDDAFINSGNYSYSQPIISNIDFDNYGMIIGVRDRYSDQTPAAGELAFQNASRGDTLRACQTNNTGNYVLENNGVCGANSVPSNRVTTRHYEELNDPAPGDKPITVRGSWGPGGAEWFAGDDQYDGDHEGSLGAIAAVPGFKDLAITQYDPTPYKTAAGNTGFFDSAGVRWVDGSNGLEKNNTIVYTGEDLRSDFMKVNGLADLEILCDEAPVEIGNRVWLDDNSNGIQDGGEAGKGGVKVDLLNAAGTVIATTNTDAKGNYKFVVPTRDVTYSVRVDLTTVPGLSPTLADQGGNDDFDSDGVIGGNFITTSVPALTAGQNTHTYDFGFVPVYALGNKVFEDKNNNGVFDTGDTPIANVAVKLLTGSGAAIAGKTTTTDANGHYYFANLVKGDYIVEVTTPAGLVSSSGTNASLSGTYEPAPDPDGTPKLDNDDNGTKFDATVTRSKAISLGNNLPAGEDQGNVANLPDTLNDYTVDFGFFRPGSLGDKVWLDTDKDGIQDAGEAGVGSVSVTLYQNACGASGTVLGTTTTDANGNYSFGNLVAGNYYVKFTLPNGMEWTVKGAGTSATDSNANTNGCTDVVALPYGGNDPTIDAGIKTPIVPIDLTIVKSITNKPVSPATFKPGDTVDYKLEVTNKGPGTALAGYSAIDILPAGLTYVAGSALGTGYSCSNTGQSLTCVSDHTLLPNVKETITLKATIASSFSTPTGSLRNVAIVKPAPGDVVETVPLDPNCEKNADGTYKDVANAATCNNVDTEEFPLPIDLVINKSITNLKTPSFLPGDDVNYKLEITNNGPASAIAGFTVTDVLPAELTYKGTVTGAGYACVITGKTVVCTSDHALAINVKDTITFTATISATLSNNTQSIVNVATVKPNPNDPSPETIPFPNCDANNPGQGTGGKTCNNVDPESFPLPKGASLGDTVWYDLDHDGVQDTGEIGVSGVKVELHDTTCAGTKIAETITDASGKYLFSNLTPGKSYVVKFIAPDGHVITTQNVGDDTKDSDAGTDGCSTPVVLADGEFNPTIDAGVFKPWASIGDFVWLDVNKNGIQDNGEVGVANISVSLLDASGNIVKTITTGTDGKYLFTNLEPGDYSVAFVIPGGYTLSPKDNGDNTKDSDAGTDGKTVKTTLDGGENDMTWDMGIYVTPASLGDYVWYDDNYDGKQDAGEKPAVGTRVLLYGEACGVGNFLAETTTDANGKYMFENLAPGKYTVKFILPDGSSFTIPNTGDDAKDSDASANGCSQVVTLNPGDNDITIDAGIVKLASLGDYVWIDSDRDGIQDAGEVGVEGVHVLLYNAQDDKISELVTDKDGKYLFTGLLPGKYVVAFDAETLPVGYQISPDNKGTDDAKDSDGILDIESMYAITQVVTLAAEEQNLTLDLGINPIPAKLGDTVWEDKDKDGIQDPGEPGIKGAKVELYMCDATGDAKPIATTTTDADGKYIFENLEAGSYYVKFISPTGMVITKSYQGGDRGSDSDAGTDGKSACVKLNPGDKDLKVDAGYYTPDPETPPVSVLPNVITRQSTLPFTGSESLQLALFAASMLGTGLLAVGFFSRKRRPGMSWY